MVAAQASNALANNAASALLRIREASSLKSEAVLACLTSSRKSASPADDISGDIRKAASPVTTRTGGPSVLATCRGVLRNASQAVDSSFVGRRHRDRK